MVIGPIANDTIFDTFGIITSGVLAPKESMQLLMIGPKYEQIALKSEKAAAQLKWLGRRVLSKDEVARYRAGDEKSGLSVICCARRPNFEFEMQIDQIDFELVVREGRNGTFRYL